MKYFLSMSASLYGVGCSVVAARVGLLIWLAAVAARQWKNQGTGMARRAPLAAASGQADQHCRLPRKSNRGERRGLHGA
jgi:hypothetical protein